jgi:hypothetical protein
MKAIKSILGLAVLVSVVTGLVVWSMLRGRE